MNQDRAVVLLSLVAAMAFPAPFDGVLAQAPPQPVSWSASLDPLGAVGHPGGRLSVAVAAKIDEGWHVYGTEELPGGPRALQITLAPGQIYTAGKLQAPEATRDFDPAFAQVTTFYSRPASFRLPIAVPAKAAAGKTTVELEVRFQACDGRICLPGRTVKLSVPLEIKRVASRFP